MTGETFNAQKMFFKNGDDGKDIDVDSTDKTTATTTHWAIRPLHVEKSLPGPLDAQNPPKPVKVMV